MASEFAAALQRLQLDDDDIAKLDGGTIDDILFRQAPRKRRKQDSNELKAELEKKYLLPSTRFSTEWLNRLQQYACPLPRPLRAPFS